MNKNQKEVEKAKLTAEQKTLDRLKNEYGQAAKEIDVKVKGLQDDIKDLNLMLQDAIDIGDTEQVNIVKSRIQSKVYQKNYQQALSKQVGGIVDNMNKKQYDTVSGYLKGCYETGYVGTMYDIAGQGIPIIQPIDQKAISKAIKLDSKVSKKLYGSYITTLKKRIQSEISRGIATAKTFQEISRDLHNQTNIGMNKAMRIARTEGHRIQNVSSNDARDAAKDKGADVLKQWDAAMDKRTRRSHAEVDGEIRETDEAFSNGMMFAGDPAGGASEVVNCRCATLTRARWALDDDELETLKQRAEFYGLDKTKNFEDYQNKYLKAASTVSKNSEVKSDIVNRMKNASSLEDLNTAASDALGIVVKFEKGTVEHAKEQILAYHNLASKYKQGSKVRQIGTGKMFGKHSAAETVFSSDYKDSAITLSSKSIKNTMDRLHSYTVKVDDSKTSISDLTHEFAHTISNSKYADEDFWKEIKSVKNKYNRALTKIEKENIVDKTITYEEAVEKKKKIFISDYANKNVDEFMAEAFSDALLTTKASLYSKEVLKIVNKYFKK